MTDATPLPLKRKLIEVALPLEAINTASAREKSIRHGHLSTLHLWWARRPLAACRDVLFASLVDDPSSDPNLTETEADLKRDELFALIEEMVQWENSNNPDVLARARAEQEIVQHLTALPRAKVRLTLEIEADIPEGVPEKVVRDVSENASALKFRVSGFEE